MNQLRIQGVRALPGFQLQLTLTNGRVVVRDVSKLLAGPVFEPLKSDAGLFSRVHVDGGTVAWENGADICPDVLIWGGPPPTSGSVVPAEFLILTSAALRTQVDSRPQELRRAS